MNKLVKPVRDLDAAARKKVEEGLGTPLADDSQIEFVPAESNGTVVDPLAEYHIYEGLTEQEIEEIERDILRPVRFRQPVE
jgi:hypothetical protein